MSDNILNINGNTLIMNGGNPLKDCPIDWDEAKKWEDEANSHLRLDEWENWRDNITSVRNKYFLWTFDCGFKVDYDGSLLHISSRFYPPKSHYGATWDGIVHVYMGDIEVGEQKFDCETLEKLKKEVEEYVFQINEKVKETLKNLKI